MSAMEIVLIIMGVVIFLLGYLLPAGKKEPDEEVQLISEDEVRKMVSGEVEGARDKISDIVEETVNYSIEKTERALERVTNEKIMAVNEYSDTVLEEINKNHKEVVFLYDMLNDKHDNLMSTINEATLATDGIKQTAKDAEITANEAAKKVKDAENAANTAIDMANAAVVAAHEAVEKVKDAESVAREAQETVQSAMQSVAEVVSKRTDLEGLHNAQLYHAEVVEEVQDLMQEEKDLLAEEADRLPAGETRVENVVTEPEEPEFTPISPRRVEIIHEPDGDYVAEEQELSTSAAFAQMGIFAPRKEDPAEPKRKTRARRTFKKENEPDENHSVDIQFTKGMDSGRNSNERILELHKAGKSNMAIAKELGLGLGEVKLVIDLFEGI